MSHQSVWPHSHAASEAELKGVITTTKLRQKDSLNFSEIVIVIR